MQANRVEEQIIEGMTKADQELQLKKEKIEKSEYWKYYKKWILERQKNRR